MNEPATISDEGRLKKGDVVIWHAYYGHKLRAVVKGECKDGRITIVLDEQTHPNAQYHRHVKATALTKVPE